MDLSNVNNNCFLYESPKIFPRVEAYIQGIIESVANSSIWAGACDYLEKLGQEVTSCESYKGDTLDNFILPAHQLHKVEGNRRLMLLFFTSLQLLGTPIASGIAKILLNEQNTKANEVTCKAYGSQELSTQIIDKLNSKTTVSIHEVFPDLRQIDHGAFPVYVSKKSGIVVKQLEGDLKKAQRTMDNAEKLKGCSSVPTHHGIFHINGKSFLIAEYVEGVSIRDKYDSLSSGMGRFTFDIDAFQIDFMSKLAIALQPIAESGICIGDDHGKNMVETLDGRIIFIDIDTYTECKNKDYATNFKANFDHNFFLKNELGVDLRNRKIAQSPFSTSSHCKAELKESLYIYKIAEQGPTLSVEEVRQGLNHICENGEY